MNEVVTPTTQETTDTKEVLVNTQPEKTFTQAEVNEMMSKRVKGVYSKLGIKGSEEIDDHVSNYEKLKNDYETLKNENTQYKQEKKKQETYETLSKHNIDSDFYDFVLTKVEQDDKFEENIKVFVESNPKYLNRMEQTNQNVKKINSNNPIDKTTTPLDYSKMSTEEYIRERRKQKER